MAARKKRGAIPRSQWIITAHLEVGSRDDPNEKDDRDGKKTIEPGTRIGDPIEMRYADSILAGSPDEVGRLIAGRLEEAAVRLKPLANKRGTK